MAQLSRYGEYLGLAFLIADDILDSHGGEFGTAAESSPKEAKKASYPSVVGIVIAREQRRELLSLLPVELETFGALAAIATQVVGRAIHMDGAT